MPRKKPPELSFQQHIRDFLVREHGYGVLEQADITDRSHCIAEDQLWAFLNATQSDTLKKLTDDYGTDARDEVFRALNKELASTPLWIILRHGLKVRGLELRLYYPKPAPRKALQQRNTAKTASPSDPTFILGRRTRKLILSSFSTACPSRRWRSNTKKT